MTPADLIKQALRTTRRHLDFEVGFVGEVRDGRRVFRYVDSKPGVDVVAVGDSDPLDETYCGRVLDGTLPEFLLDPSLHPVSAGLPVTHELPVGTHLSVPVQLPNGQVWGTFCCFSFEVRDSVREEQLVSLRMMADMVAEQIDKILAEEQTSRRSRDRLQRTMDDPRAMKVVFQPLFDLDTMEIVGVEALARFPGSGEGPQWFFAEAVTHGLRQELEMRAVRLALSAMEDIPSPIRLNLNVSPDTLYTEEFFEAVRHVPTGRLVVEVTEHAAIDDYTQLRASSQRLADKGIGLAIDDVGMGFSGLTRILESSPEELKLDAAVIRDVDTRPVKQAMVEAFASFGQRAGFGIVAEGIETAAELDMLRDLGIRTGQGFHLGRPRALAQVLSWGVPAGSVGLGSEN